MTKTDRLSYSHQQNWAKKVIATNERKNLYFEFNSLIAASFFTKTNIAIVHKIVYGKRLKKTPNGWWFVAPHFEIKKMDYMCKRHKVNYTTPDCPLCRVEKMHRKELALFREIE